MSDQPLGDESSPGKKSGAQARLLVVALLAVGLAAFVVQNTESTPVTWLVFERSAPLWVVIIASAATGAVLTELAGWVMRRRRRKDT